MPHSECFIDGIFYPSVTTIIGAKPKPWLDAWRDKWGVLAERKTELSGAIGTEFHRCIECLLNNGNYQVKSPGVDGVPFASLIPRVQGMMRSFEMWLAGVREELITTELKVVSRAYVYSGTLDAIIQFKKLTLTDWKSSGRIYDDMQLQLAAYAQAYNERCESKADCIKDGLIVCVSKDKPDFKLTTKAFKLGKRPFKEFLKLRALFDDIRTEEKLNAEIADGEATGC